MNIGRNLRVIAYSATAATADNYATNTGGVAGAALAGDSLVMEQTEGPSRIVWWSQLNQTAGGARLITNSGHDTTRGFVVSNQAGNLANLLNRGIPFEVGSGETMRIQVYGTGVAGDVESGIMLVERRIQGGGGNYINFEELKAQRHRQVNVKVSLAAAAAGYGTEEALNAETSLLNTGEDYAILGASVGPVTGGGPNLAGIVMRGAFSGGQKIAVPGNSVDAWPPGNDFFCELSRVYRGPFIPKFRGGDAPNIMCSIIADENVTAADVTFHLMQLK